MAFTLPKIYPITDTRISGLSHTEQVKQLIGGGARIIQIREKYAASRNFYDDARECVMIARSSGVTLIVNDRVDIAMATGADGIHLGQDDLPPGEARSLLGNSAVIGYSTHSVEQALSAIGLPIDYIAIGPIFTTFTKDDPDEIVGLKGLRAVRDAIGDLPLVAIGGLTEANLHAVFEAGADSAAMIGALLSDPPKISDRMRRFSADSADRL